MGTTNFAISEKFDHLEKLVHEMMEHVRGIRALQAACHHQWRFGFQINAHHETDWIVVYQCMECTLQRQVVKLPVCEDCDTTLERTDKEAADVQEELKKPEHSGWHMNSPLAYRCPNCQKLHILRHRGD